MNTAIALALWAATWVLCRALATLLVLTIHSTVAHTDADARVIGLAILADLVRAATGRTQRLLLLLGWPVIALGLAVALVAVVNGTSLVPVPAPGSPGLPILSPRLPMSDSIEAAGRAGVAWALKDAAAMVAMGMLLCTASVRSPWMRQHIFRPVGREHALLQAGVALGGLLMFLMVFMGAVAFCFTTGMPYLDPAAVPLAGLWRTLLALHFAIPCAAAGLAILMSWCVLNAMAWRREQRQAAKASPEAGAPARPTVAAG